MDAWNGLRGSTQEYADLEIALQRRDAVSWGVDLRFSLPGADADTELDVAGPILADLDAGAFADLDDDEEYGRALGRGLFGHGVGEGFRQAVAMSQSRGLPLRVRLAMGTTSTDAADLHALQWEKLREPEQGATLWTDERVLFSRYLSSHDWRPIGVRTRDDLTALAVVSAPDDLESLEAGRPLAPVRLEEELERAREGLGAMRLTTLPGAGQATLANVVAHLRRGCDVLYLACHGYVRNREPVLLLVDDEGHATTVLGSELVARLSELPLLPRLVFLASCQSAGAGPDASSDDGGLLAALGPRLAEIGVPAVVAMQGDVTMQTAASFAKEFFARLDDHGLVDRAMAAARGAVRDRPDWWAPTLFMRLKSGRLWHVQENSHYEKWPSLIDDLERSECTPLIGPGISDALLGTRQEIARDWARTFGFPLAEHTRQSLPDVAQYLSITQNSGFLRREFMKYLRRTLVDRYRDDLPTELLAPGASLEDRIAAAWGATYRERDRLDPYTVLASLPVDMYVTTQPSQLLVRALTEAGRHPEVEVCRWHDEVDRGDRGAVGGRAGDGVLLRDPSYRPTIERPLVYHLLGTFDEPETLVLTQDQYFDFLIGISRNRKAIPALVRRRLIDSALMLVGFRLDDWDFRVLNRSVLSAPGVRRRDDYTNVAVQIDPDDPSVDVNGARKYLEKYFQKGDISVYWGTTEHFLQQLHDRWEGRDR